MISPEQELLKKGIEETTEFLKPIVGSPLNEIGLMLSTPLKVRALKNQLDNLDKVKKLVAERGITLKQVNLKVLFPYLNAIALEEEPLLQDLWANLFTNYIDANKSLEIHVYPEILKQISTKEGEILKYVYCYGEIATKNNLEIVVEEELLNNMERLGLLEFPVKNQAGMYIASEEDIRLTVLGIYKLSAFGTKFCEACGITDKKVDPKPL